MKSKGLLGGKYSTAREEEQEQEVEEEVQEEVEEGDSDMETLVENNKREHTESVKMVVSSECKNFHRRSGIHGGTGYRLQ